jgi:hypothetical protein
MSKCRPDCCPGNSSDGLAVVFGLLVLAAAVYGIIRAIWHVIRAIWHIVVQIIEITAITLGSIFAAVVLAVIAVQLIRWQRSRREAATTRKLTSLDPAGPSAISVRRPGKPPQDAAELFAEAVANDMDPRFVERILKTAMERGRR